MFSDLVTHSHTLATVYVVQVALASLLVFTAGYFVPIGFCLFIAMIASLALGVRLFKHKFVRRCGSDPSVPLRVVCVPAHSVFRTCNLHVSASARAGD